VVQHADGVEEVEAPVPEGKTQGVAGHGTHADAPGRAEQRRRSVEPDHAIAAAFELLGLVTEAAAEIEAPAGAIRGSEGAGQPIRPAAQQQLPDVRRVLRAVVVRNGVEVARAPAASGRVSEARSQAPRAKAIP
jgi:hypothetical protein